MVRAFNEEEVQTLKQSLIGRALLPPEPGKDKLTKVYIVKSLLEGFEAKYNEDITLSTWPWGLFAATRRWIASHSRSTHWAVEIRGDFYETFRQKQYSWPEWAATLRLTKKELAVNERIVVERLYVGTTACSDREIAGRGLLYEQQLRPYSLAGDNCQQFILQFCREIGVEFDHDAMGRLKTATGLIQAIRLCLFLLAALFVVDLSVNKGRLILATPITPAIGLSTLSFVTLAHPRMFLSSFSSLPPTFAHILYCLHSGVVWLLWVVFGVWTAFSVETGCDDKGFSMVNGEKISYFWNPCNVALRLFQLALFVIALAGALYHDFYTFYFVKGR